MNTTLPSVTIVRRIRATPARVWAAITQPEQMLQWWSPDAGPTLSVEADVRPGGRFSIVFRLMNGQQYNPTGTYREVVPHEKLSFTWERADIQMPEPLSVVTFLLKAIDDGVHGGTELVLTHEQLPDEDSIRSHHAGWCGLLDKLPPFLGAAPWPT